MRDSGRLLHYLAFVSLYGAVAAQSKAQSPPPLAGTDFRLGPVPEGTDSLVVRRRLGRPDSVGAADAAPDATDKLVIWHYPHFRLYFTRLSIHGVIGVEATDSTYATGRGLRVGDSETRLKRLYGEPVGTHENIWDYDDPSARLHVLRLTIRNGRILAIYVGWILD